ncbi:MAG TPA: UvrD-helicase domain-containing protein [Treponemataceae bacterium]|nr:UvrD-helicase domain-containing protein [Treponemataceae bacterium]
MKTVDYLSVLNTQQREAVKHTGSSLLILAGAGSGKTRVITTKIAYLINQKDVEPYRILALTFTKKAATEMAQRARELEPLAIKTPIRTFHSFGAWFLRNHYEEAGIDKNFTVYDDDDMVTLLTKAIPSMPKKQASLVAHKIAWCKNYCMSPDSPDLVKLVSDPDFPGFYTAYQARLKETGNVDFGDLIMLPVQILKNNNEVRKHMYNRFHVIMVDEYQDSNVAQFLLIQQLCGPDTYIAVVGDEDQSIYKFRGAEIQNILTYQDHFSNTKIIKLERNYRSTAPILKTANDVISHNTERLGKKLIAERGGGKRPKLIFLPNQDDETKFCAELVEQAYKKGCPYSDWAILYRTNAQSLGFETEFLHRKIPYTVVGSLKFYQREEIKDVLAWLSFIANPRDEIAFRRIINKPARGIGAKTQDKIIAATRLKRSEQYSDGENNEAFNLIDGCYEVVHTVSKKAKSSVLFFLQITQELANDLDESLASAQRAPYAAFSESAAASLFDGVDLSPEEAVGLEGDTLACFIEKIVTKSGLSDYHGSQDEIAGTQRVANLQELCNSAVLYPSNREGLLDFLDHVELDRNLDLANEDAQDAVTLITLHNTKGLEFSRVIITGLEKGIFPRRDKTEDEIEEERRLCYVGLTRARDELYLTSCEKRRMYGKTDFMEPSPFLLEIVAESIDVIGKKPRSFKHPCANIHTQLSNSTNNKLAQKWHKGAKIYHDEWGYGAIINTNETNDEYVITVQFEHSGVKHFMPEYQVHSLMVCKD